MFDLGWGELLVIAIVALIAIGPKELPGVLRVIGQWTGKMRRMAAEFQEQFREAMREAEMTELQKQVNEVSSAASDLTSFDPLATVRKEIEGALGDQPTGDQAPSSAPSTPSLDTASVSATAEPIPAAPQVSEPNAPPKAGEGA